jgi:predicted phage replisome organizer
MSVTKKYYWLKLNIDFFDREEIKLIENSPNGKDYIIFYMKLLLKSTNTDGRLMFKDVIPYTDEMLATITNTNIDVVRSAVKMFIQLGMMDKLDDGALFMIETQNMIGTETEYARKKREYREKVKQGLLEDKTQDNIETKKDIVRQEIEKEIDIELDKDKDDDTKLDKLNKIEDEKKLDEPKEEKEVRPTDSSSIEFKNNLNKLREIVIKSTGLDKFRVENVILASKYREVDMELLLKKISESKFLLGEDKKRKPTITNFSVKSMIDLILADGYKDKPDKTKKEFKFNKTEYKDFTGEVIDEILGIKGG